MVKNAKELTNNTMKQQADNSDNHMS